MNRIQRIRRPTAVLTGLVGALLAFGAAPAALAAASLPLPPPDTIGSTAPVQIRTVVTGGMPGWQITLIAIGAALFAAAATMLAGRVRLARRRRATAAVA